MRNRKRITFFELDHHDDDEDSQNNIQHQKTKPNQGIPRWTFTAFSWWKTNTHKLGIRKQKHLEM